MTAAPPYFDPPFKGWSPPSGYGTFDVYPFFYPVTPSSGECTIASAPCPPFPLIVSSDGTTLSFADDPGNLALSGQQPSPNPTGNFLAFSTSLVGVSSQAIPGSVSCGPSVTGSSSVNYYCTNMYSWTWISTRRGTAGGVDQTSSYFPVDPGGTGGVSLTSVNGIPTPTVTVTPSAQNITTGQTLVATVAVAGGNSTSSPTGTVILTSGTYSSNSKNLSGGSTMISIPAGVLAAGSDTLTVAYSPDVASATSFSTSAGFASVTVTTPTYSMSGTAVTVTPGASGNSIVTVSSTNGYSGIVTLACSVTASPPGASDIPTCSVGQMITLSSVTTSGTSTVTVSTMAPSAALGWPSPGNHNGADTTEKGAILALLALLAIPARRRGWHSMLGIFVVATMLVGMTGCGSGSGSNPTHQANLGTTAGAYTITVTGAGNDTAHTTTTTTFTMTVT
jgi:hypothetical protein